MIESRGEDDVGDAGFAFDKFLENAEAVEAGHLHVEENQVGRMFLDEIDGFQAIFSLADEIDLGKTLQEKGEFVTCGLLVVNDDRVDGHGVPEQYTAMVRRKSQEEGLSVKSALQEQGRIHGQEEWRGCETTGASSEQRDDLRRASVWAAEGRSDRADRAAHETRSDYASGIGRGSASTAGWPDRADPAVSPRN